MKKLYAKEIRDKYQDQKWMAKSRGIKFEMTIDQWVGWWKQNLGRNWLKKRGCKSGQYVMARKGDKGPYTLENVECITSNKNHADMKKYRSYAITNVKLLPEAVCEIFCSHPSQEAKLCKKYDTRFSYIAMIKRREVWADLTKDFGEPEIKGYVKGTAHPACKLTEAQVRGIFLAKGPHKNIAVTYGVRVGKVQSIKSGRGWRSVTASLGPVQVNPRGPYKKRSPPV